MHQQDDTAFLYVFLVYNTISSYGLAGPTWLVNVGHEDDGVFQTWLENEEEGKVLYATRLILSAANPAFVWRRAKVDELRRGGCFSFISSSVFSSFFHFPNDFTFFPFFSLSLFLFFL